MRDDELSSGEIAAQFDVTGPAISQHLGVLKEAGLVTERRAGTRRLYRARPEGLRDVRAFLEDFWDDGLERLRDGRRTRPTTGRRPPTRRRLMAQLEREIMIDATPETIFPLLTTTEGMLRWEGTEGEIDARPGGVYRILTAGAHLGLGEFVEVVPNEKVRFTFGWDQPGNPITPGSTEVEITLHPEGSKTLVRLVHRGLPDDAVSDHTQGWDHYLGRLAVVAAGGDPGPDTRPQG